MEPLSDTPPFPVFVSPEAHLPDQALVQYVESYASVITGLTDIFEPASSRSISIAFFRGILGFSLEGGPTLLWLSLRSLERRHREELKVATARRAAALARLSKYVAADVIGGTSERVDSPSKDCGTSSDFLLGGAGHIERGVFCCAGVSESLQRAESVARVGGCWAVLLAPPGGQACDKLVVLSIARDPCAGMGPDDEEADAAGESLVGGHSDEAVPGLLPSEAGRVRRRAHELLGSAPLPAGQPPTSPTQGPHLVLLPWGPAVLCVGDAGEPGHLGGNAGAYGPGRPASACADVAKLITEELEKSVNGSSR